ncbi:GUN4 domain-containing protein [Cyanobium sp. NIES-981]|uniref:GUN4 domain-containing protein n=1 Tax=Cyanobium sp. NIES-981 TaxID=1851505 RepID=UPI0007DD6430|nr:GUN4 domain-containing protein [Cyanobium sp. NIES-981]SBO42367.1 Ycf53-like protein [Cyanobium sp. NIES-981]
MLSGSPVSANASPEALLERFQAASPRQRRSLLKPLQERAQQLRPLILDHLAGLDATGDDWAAGALIQLLLAGDGPEATEFLQRYPEGWLATTSASGIAYGPLQSHLARQQFEQADRLTSALLRELAGPGAVARGYVYYSEVPAMAAADLDTLDRLWVCYSRGRFGFSVQGRLLQACNGRWDQLWPRLAWKEGGRWTRYPGSFQWSIEAPEGHMPLVNQLRGVRLMDALLQHPALQQRINGATP